jgi:hypothetical protein
LLSGQPQGSLSWRASNSRRRRHREGFERGSRGLDGSDQQLVDHGRDDLVDDRMAEIALGGEALVELAEVEAGARRNAFDARTAEALTVDFVKRGVEDRAASLVRLKRHPPSPLLACGSLETIEVPAIPKS